MSSVQIKDVIDLSTFIKLRFFSKYDYMVVSFLFSEHSLVYYYNLTIQKSQTVRKTKSFVSSVVGKPELKGH